MKRLITCVKAIALTLGLAMAGQTAQAQNVKWGQENKATSKHYYPTILGEDSEGIYTFAQERNKYVVEMFNKKTMAKEFSREVEPPRIKGIKKVEIENVEFIDGQFLVFISQYKKESKKNEVYAFTVNAKTGKTNDKHVTVLDIPVEKKRRRGDYDVYISEDKSKILVKHEGYYKEAGKYVVRHKLIDSDLNVLLSKEESYKKEDDDYKSYNYILDNDGSVYYARRANNKFYIGSFDANRDFEKWEEAVDEIKVERVGLFNTARFAITDMVFNINAENDLVVAGYYSKPEVKTKKNGKQKTRFTNSLDGCYYLKIDNLSKEVMVSKVTEFDKEFKDQFLTKRQAKKGKDKNNATNSFDSNMKILDKADGGIVLLGEQFYYQRYTDGNGNTTAERWHYGDIVAINFTAEGELIWANRIPKNQDFFINYSYAGICYGPWGVSWFSIPQIRQHYSYLAGFDGNKLIVAYNDHIKNLERTTETHERQKNLKRLGNAVVTKHEINLLTGKRTKSLFTEAQNSGVYFKPNVSYQGSQGENLVIFAKKGKRYKFGTVDLKAKQTLVADR